MEHQTISAHVVQGHRVASGLNNDERFPGGTLKMQVPFFNARGLITSHLYLGTVNVSIAPLRYKVVTPRYTFAGVKWHPTEPAEDFSFFDVDVILAGKPPVSGFIYYPHPDTKPEHFQRPDVIELWLPFVDGLAYGTQLSLKVPKMQMAFESNELPLETKSA